MYVYAFLNIKKQEENHVKSLFITANTENDETKPTTATHSLELTLLFFIRLHQAIVYRKKKK